jgi:secreted trypsin-like serine protease
VGGNEANPHSWPASSFIVFQYKTNLQVKNRVVPVDKQSICGGFLVDRTTVVTAAHCIQEEISVQYDSQSYTVKVVPNSYFPTIGSMYKIYLGLHDNTGALNGNAPYPGKQVLVKQVIKHPRYDDANNLNDIAILKLASPVQLDRNVQIVCLPNPKVHNYPGTTGIPAFAVGWGTLYSDGPTSNTLQNVKFTLYDGAYCENVAPYSTLVVILCF